MWSLATDGKLSVFVMSIRGFVIGNGDLPFERSAETLEEVVYKRSARCRDILPTYISFVSDQVGSIPAHRSQNVSATI